MSSGRYAKGLSPTSPPEAYVSCALMSVSAWKQDHI
jgi:hypothetical protein